MFSTFDLCLLLYVIRLAGWLKHCNLSVWGVSGAVWNRKPTVWLTVATTVALSQIPNVGILSQDL